MVRTFAALRSVIELLIYCLNLSLDGVVVCIDRLVLSEDLVDLCDVHCPGRAVLWRFMLIAVHAQFVLLVMESKPLQPSPCSIVRDAMHAFDVLIDVLLQKGIVDEVCDLAYRAVMPVSLACVVTDPRS